MPNKKDLENPLSEIDVWKILLKSGVHVYSDGLYNLNGIFGRSITFGIIKVDPKELHIIMDKDGSIKEPWLTRLAYFMKAQRSKSYLSSGLDNHVLVVLGIMKLITESSVSGEKDSL